ncbi:FAD-dependent oxidoreductase [Arthrobacter polaris]|uniref:FAD-dependent oxidoreductase n=1 Tax=Arthrobacter polaris TaxID=2813727 RepID=UPI001F1DDB69|nr:FAD-dependent oxidoreductase [Arthrobacter polaris]UIK88522.1 hypothetical protein J0916_14385 [Arthrobacter polaris]
MEASDKPAAPIKEGTQSPPPGFPSLRRNLSGALYEPDESKYTELATAWNIAVITSPAAVVEAANAQDVVEALNFAATSGLPVSV